MRLLASAEAGTAAGMVTGLSCMFISDSDTDHSLRTCLVHPAIMAGVMDSVGGLNNHPMEKGELRVYTQSKSKLTASHRSKLLYSVIRSSVHSFHYFP